jgi:ADP-heptose:LPS heptosyltransferase
MQAAKDGKPIQLLVIQLARLGDTLQSLMALRAAKQLYPQIRIHFVARQSFALAAEKVPWIEKVYTLPTEEILSQPDALKALARWVTPMATQPWDLLFNWSFSEASSYLCGLLPARVKLGFSRRNDLSFTAIDGWSHYVQAVVQSATTQNIHLTDILTTQLLTALQIHVGDPSDDGNSAVTSKGFFKLESQTLALGPNWRDPTRRWIGLQIGSNNPERTWTASAWAAFATRIMTQSSDTSLLLMGGPDDIEKEREILSLLPDSLKNSRQLQSIVGRAEFDAWAAAVGRCQWVVAGDTSVVHLASVLGTRVLHLALNSPKWAETGPYGNGHYVLAAGPGSTTLDPEAAYQAWAYAAGEWALRKQVSLEEHFRSKKLEDALSKICVFRSRIRGTNEGGGVYYEPMNHQSLNLEDWGAQVIGHMARAWYCGWVPKAGMELDRAAIGPHLIQNLRRLKEASEVLAKICEEAKRTSLELHSKSSKLRSDKIMRLSDQEDLRGLGRKLMDLEELIDRLAGNDPVLTAFSRMTRVLMHNLRGDRLAVLGKESATSYSQIIQGVTVLREWIQITLDLVKPVAITPGKVLEFRSGPPKETHPS